MCTNIESLCNQSTSSTETSIMFWTLIIAIISLLATIVISIVSNHQNAKLNSITMMKECVGKTFEKVLLNEFCENINDCNCRFVSANQNADVIYVSFDKFPLVKVQNKISTFLGEIAYLQYAIPFRYSRLNSMGKQIEKYIENEMLPYAIFEKAPNKIEFENINILEVKKAQKIYRIFLKKVKKFYKKAFKIYKYGL